MTILNRYVSVALAAMACVPCLSAQPGFSSRLIYDLPKPPSTQPAAPVAALVEALASGSSDLRDAAEKSLLGMGPAILPQLQWALEQEQAGILPNDFHGTRTGVQYGPGSVLPRHSYHELTVLIDHLDEPRRSMGTLVTMHYKDAPFIDILRDFGSQRAARLAVTGAFGSSNEWVNSSRASIDLDRVNYWDAFGALLKKLNLFGIEAFAHESTVGQGMARQSYPFDIHGQVVSGPLLIAPLSVESRRAVNVASGAKSSSLVLTLQAAAEPKLRAGSHAVVTIDECVDDRGQSLVTGTRPRFAPVNQTGSREWNWVVPLELHAPAAGRRVQTLRGQWSVGIGPPSQSLIINDVMKAKGQSLHFDGIVITVASFSTPPFFPFYRIDLDIAVPAGSPLVQPSADASDTEQPLRFEGIGVLDQTRLTIQRNVVAHSVRHEGDRDVIPVSVSTYDVTRIPFTLIWNTPSETRWLTLPFTLHDIVVPSPTTQPSVRR